MNRVIIVTGGNCDCDFTVNFLKENKYDYIIAVDGGLKYLHKLGVKPNCLVGDFDTIDKNILDLYIEDKNIEVIKLIPEKDYTDTHTAMNKAIELKPKEICVLGGIGTRMDHTISNVQLLLLTLDVDINARMINENNNIYLINKDMTIVREDMKGKYISLIPFTDKVIGVTLEGFKYPLKDFDFDKMNSVSLGVSNELVEETGKISLESGILLVIEAND